MGEKDLEEPVDKAKAGDEDENHPPPPEDEEVVLVEHIVGQKTEDVLLVGVPSDSTSLHCARDLGGKEMAHRVEWTGSLWKIRVGDEVIVGLDIDAIAGKFVVEEGVEYALADKDDN